MKFGKVGSLVKQLNSVLFQELHSESEGAHLKELLKEHRIELFDRTTYFSKTLIGLSDHMSNFIKIAVRRDVQMPD